MRLIEKAYAIAKHELGVHETGNNNPRILDYLRCVDLRESELEESTPWCSAFANFCVQKSGGRGTHNAMARSWLHWGKKLDIPTEGCIVVFERGGNDYSGHVAFFVGYDEKKQMVKVLGGNQKDSVCYSDYFTHSILGFRTSID